MPPGNNNSNIESFNSRTTHIWNTMNIIVAIVILIILQSVGLKYTYCTQNNAECNFKKFVVNGGTLIYSFEILLDIMIFIGIKSRNEKCFIPFFFANWIGMIVLGAMSLSYFGDNEVFDEIDRHLIHLPIMVSLVLLVLSFVNIYSQFENLKKEKLLERQHYNSGRIEVGSLYVNPTEFERLTNTNQHQSNYEQQPSSPRAISIFENSDKPPSYDSVVQNNETPPYGWKP